MCIRPFLIVKSLVVSSAGLYCRGCTGEGVSSLELEITGGGSASQSGLTHGIRNLSPEKSPSAVFCRHINGIVATRW